jgi:hypothetical protein
VYFKERSVHYARRSIYGESPDDVLVETSKTNKTDKIIVLQFYCI